MAERGALMMNQCPASPTKLVPPLSFPRQQDCILKEGRWGGGLNITRSNRPEYIIIKQFFGARKTWKMFVTMVEGWLNDG